MNWNTLSSIEEIQEIKKLSNEQFILIFKHSTSCSISSLAKRRLDSDIEVEKAGIIPYFLDLVRFRHVSNEIESQFDVRHESPQVLLVKNGVCTFDSSHLDINPVEIVEAISHKVF